MNHKFAAQTLTVERYFLGEMPSKERDTFEEHYFSCAACANEVHFTAVFMSNAKAVLSHRVDLRPPTRLAWLRPNLAVPACAVFGFAALAGYQNMVTIPALKAPQSIGPVTILDGATRASLPQLRFGEPLRFQLAATPDTMIGVWRHLAL